MGLFLFKKKDFDAKPVVKSFGKTHKKKNTYVVALSGALMDFNEFALCETTPLAVVTLNGKAIQQGGGWRSCTEFPNPGAIQMCFAFKALTPFMGENLSATIVEYLDKHTAKPVLTLYPQNQVYFHNLATSVAVHVEQRGNDRVLFFQQATQNEIDEVEKLNHATRQDLFAQVEKRQKFISQYNMQCNK